MALYLFASFSFSQKKYLTREIQIENDNDTYTLNIYRDQYYSNGLALRYRVLTDSSRWGTNMEKVIRTYEFNHRIYSPKDLNWERLEQLDRPYAGQMSIGISNEFYFKRGTYLHVKLELGWMGPALRTGELQYSWHKALGMRLPHGWQFQINDAPIVNGYGTYAHKLIRRKLLDLISESNAAIGTSFIYARQELTIRFGSLKPIQQSTHYNGVLGVENTGYEAREIYFFLSPGIEYVAYNATIEGNWLGKESVHTETRIPGIFQMRAGIMASWFNFDFALLYYRRTKETTEATPHKYIGIRVNQRF
ncbi:MAG: lipid A deacylase LpxR family protein [Ekhidna sp.]|uniref:lipid A deacylase LpxR family protein n=1 Tax=Ekhidna sp. TaxID=2608089 RepID=UPI0032ECA6EA